MRHKVIPRPDFDPTGGRAPIYPYREILATLGTEKAVLIPLTSKRPEQVISSIGKVVRRQGLRFRHRREKAGVAVWVEKATA